MLRDDIKKQVETSCAVYAGDGQCLLDRPCPFFNAENESLPRCGYYENAVLPEDDRLKARYWQSFGLAHWGEDSKPCKRCENLFTPSDKRQQYCSDCKEIKRRQAARDRKRKQRQTSVV